jgi:Na+/melibiose symporter-like transporter
MIQFQRNKLFYFAAILLLVGFAALTFHPLIHATHHVGDKTDADHCAICQFVTTFGFILFCIFLFSFKSLQERFSFSEFKQSLPFKFLSPIHGRAPPSLS